ncbi:DUF397 domain-containing protein [Saccharopolyspora hattusasensis]|uniref:DUF397 domain-containing protein n=1 Tax=Saccharopolyspora hattusasensis TaxID=1128679 RepID=UPI003D96C07A
MMKLMVNGAALEFVKASKSHLEGSQCLHVAADGDNVHLLESDNKGVILSTTRVKFAAFLDGAKKGEFDFAC